MHNKIAHLLIFVFILAFCGGLFFTYGLHFFWEDIWLYHLDKEQFPPQLEESAVIIPALKTLQRFAREFFQTHRLFQIGFVATSDLHRPYQHLTFNLMRIIFKDKIALNRIFKSMFFAINACLLFLIINRSSALFALLGVFIYIASAEVWIALAYCSDVALYVEGAVLFSLLLFFKLLEKGTLKQSELWLRYFLILAVSNYAVLSKGDGRYFAIIFFITLLCFRRKQLPLHLPMLAVLLVMEVPVFGYIKKIFTGTPVSPIDIASRNPLPLPQALKTIISNNKFPRVAMGDLLLVLLAIVILIHLYFLLFRIFRKILRKGAVVSDNARPNILLRERLLTAFLCLIFTLIGAGMSRNFNYTGKHDWSMLDCSHFIAPFIIFLSFYIALVRDYLRRPYRLIFLVMCIGFIIVEIMPNKIVRLNDFRGGWGNYFCAWRNTEKYIDKTANNALALAINDMPYKPFVFRNSNNRAISSFPAAASPFFDLNYIENEYKGKGYKDIFVVKRGVIEFRGKLQNLVLIKTKIIDGDSGDLYDRFKRLIGRPSRPVIYVYHFKFKDS